jgi:hypothetical protein
MGAGFWATRRVQFRVLQVAGVQISALVTRVHLPSCEFSSSSILTRLRFFWIPSRIFPTSGTPSIPRILHYIVALSPYRFRDPHLLSPLILMSFNDATSTGMGPRGAPFLFYDMDKQHNISSVRLAPIVWSGRDGIHRKVTEFVCLEKLYGDSNVDTAGPSTTSLPEIVSHASLADGHRELKVPPVHCQGLFQGEYVVMPT